MGEVHCSDYISAFPPLTREQDGARGIVPPEPDDTGQRRISVLWWAVPLAVFWVIVALVLL